MDGYQVRLSGSAGAAPGSSDSGVGLKWQEATIRVQIRLAVSPSSSVTDFSAGEVLQGEPGVVGAAMVVSTEGDAVREIGDSALAPGMGMMHVAPGEGSFASFGGARGVLDGFRSSLGLGVEASFAADVERF